MQWMAFIGKPSSGLAGVKEIPMWTAGSKCAEISFIGVVSD